MKLLFLFSTRPEGIKLAPVTKVFKEDKNFSVRVCSTGQHKEMLEQVLNFFQIRTDYNLNIMKKNQSLFDITADILKALEPILGKERPDLVFVQGDTTTALIGALASFYKKIPVAHIEAGLRSFNKYSPFPEEMNRILVGHLADYHFAPTQKAKENLLNEGIKEHVFVVGNTVIDALFLGLDIIREQGEEKFYKYFDFIDFSKKIILVTGHRRESFGEPFKNICYALKEIANKYKEEVEIVYPVHLNPNVRKPVFDILKDVENIYLIEPLDYPYLIWLMEKSYLILTDSGGLQEEAPSLGKPVLVIRNITERMEGIEAGIAKLVGTDKDKIVKEATNLIENELLNEKMAKAVNPYGEGNASIKIKEIILQNFFK